MTPDEITKLVESTAFYQHPEDSNIVYVNLERLKSTLTENLSLTDVSIQRKLLIAFLREYHTSMLVMQEMPDIDEMVDEYLSNL